MSVTRVKENPRMASGRLPTGGTRLHPGNRRWMILLVGVAATLMLTWGVWAVHRLASIKLDAARQKDEEGKFVRFDKRESIPVSSKGIHLWQSTSDVRGIARFRDSYFAATDGGLIERFMSGELRRHYTTLDGLPESDLTCLATHDERLYIGTKQSDLLAFDGERFERYVWLDRDAQAVTVLVSFGGRLLIGTFGGGLIEFDRARFREIKAGAKGEERVQGVNALLATDARLFVATFAAGLWVREGDVWRCFTTADGLASNRVVGVVSDEATVLVATDLGIVACPTRDLTREIGGRRFRIVTTMPALSGISRVGDAILFCRDDGELYISKPDTRGNTLVSTPLVSAGTSDATLMNRTNIAWERPAGLMNCRIAMLDNRLWLYGSRGVWREGAQENGAGDGFGSYEAARTSVSNSPNINRLSFKFFGEKQSAGLSNNVISALAVGRGGELWAGTFRNGVDIMDARGKRLAHVESEMAKEINSLTQAGGDGSMLVATSHGVMRLDSAAREKMFDAEGLHGNSVAHIAVQTTNGNPRQARLACATNRGLSFGKEGAMRLLTTVQGLPSNNAYTVLAQGEAVFVGTLGGLAEVVRGRVVRVWTTANSELRHNWITSLRQVGSRIFVGTYGGGVCELTAAGELRAFGETGKAFVNPNAMWADDKRLYAGTLDGVWIYELRSGKWRLVRTPLPGAVVLSITGDATTVYVGTTNGIARVEEAFWSETDSDL